MTTFVALLRAINVGGTGTLPMSELRALCEGAGFKRVTTYIQSGNVVFTSVLSEAKVKTKLEQALAVKMGKPFGALVRTGAQLETVVTRNPFKTAAPNQLLILFLNEAPEHGALEGLSIPGREQLKLDGREVFIHFPDGMGQSKLKVPFSKTSTGRNLNTVTKLVALAKEIENG
jgi:uncharacterized protein (DUF1697 family)